MEYYESTCKKCGHKWRWVGYKTGYAKGSREFNKKKGNECPRCGHNEADVGLDHTSEEAQALDGALGSAITDIFSKLSR